MPSSTPNDLAPLRRLAFFSLALSAAVIGAIALARIGLPTQWAPIGAAWVMLCAALLAPLALLDRIGISTAAWPRDLLAGPAIVATLILLWLVGFLGTAGLAVIAVVAIVALLAALAAEIPALRPGRLVAWLVVVLLLAIPLAGTLDGTKYANFIADRLMLFGRADGDTLFHAALINALRYYGVTATGIDGIAPTSYHVGVHLLTARIAAMTNADAIPALIAVRAVLATPLVFFAIAAGGIAWARRRDTAVDRPMLAAIAAFVLTLGVGTLRIGAAGFDSESVILAAALIMLAFPAFLLAATGPGLGAIGWTAAVALVLPLAAAKISFGFVWGGLVGWWALRKLGLRRGAFWLVAVADLLLFGLGMWLFNPGGGEQTIWFGTPYYVGLIRNGDLFGPVLVNLIGFVLVAVLAWAWRRPEPPALGGVQARDAVESLAIAFVLANLPGALMEIFAGDAFYFIVVFGWLSLPLMTGEVLRQAERRAGQRSAYAAAAVAILACLVGLALLGQRQWQLVAGTEALVRTGDPQYYSGKGRKNLRLGAAAAMKDLGVRGILTTAPGVAPADPVVAALHRFRAAAGNGGSLYVVPSSAGYWGLTEDCDGKSLFAMATAGVPMLDGYYPDQAGCGQEFALLGYRGVPADLGKPLDDAAICARAAAARSTSVLVLSDAAAPRTLSCAAPGQ